MKLRRATRCLLSLGISAACGVAVASMGSFFHLPTTAAVQTPAPTTLAVPADSPRWELEGRAQASSRQGRACLLLDGGLHFSPDPSAISTTARWGWPGEASLSAGEGLGQANELQVIKLRQSSPRR